MPSAPSVPEKDTSRAVAHAAAPSSEAAGSFSAVLIGGSSLLTGCAQVLLDRGHEVRALVSDDERVRQWAAERGVPVVRPAEDLPGVLARWTFDYLFSVVNLRILPGEVLALPQRGAVNFHDALLPRDAGVNASAWAVWLGHERHGVTWHEMAAGVDEGGILSRREVAVDPAVETSHSLHVKCFAAALDTFAELADELAEGRERPRAQDLSCRTYHGRVDRPDGGMVLDWSCSAAELARQVRACDFGGYDNPFGSAGVWLGDRLVAVRAAEVLPRSGRQPGTVVATGADGVRVACRDGDLLLRHLAGLDGTRLPHDAAPWRAGARLPMPDAERRSRWRQARRQALRHEAYWVRRLSELRLPRLPMGPAGEVSGGALATWEVRVPEWVRGRESPEAVLLAALGAYLARVCSSGLPDGDEEFDLGLRWGATRTQPAELCAPVVSLRVAPAPDGDFAGYADEVAARLERTLAKGTHLRDLPLRYGGAAGCPTAYPVVVECADGPGEELAPQPGTALTVRLADGHCTWLTDASLLSDGAAGQLADGFSAFLDALPDQGARHAPLLAAAAYERVLTAANRTTTDYPADRPVHQLVAVQAKRLPDTVAVVGGDRSMSYAELEERAGAVARHLTAAGIGPGDLVGVLLPRSADLVAALLGVLKAGAAYVPLDPLYPPARITGMLADAGVRLLVTHSEVLTAPVADAVPEVLCLDRDRLRSGPEPGDKVGELAYVIYTSGSTGRPKGVRVRHQGLTNLLCAMADEPGFEAGDRMLAVTTPCFDIAALELFLPLIRGGTVEICDAATAADGRALAARIAASRPTHLQATPASWKLLLAAGWPGDPRLKALCGGEALPQDLADELSVCTRELWNLYGPTETTIWSAATRIHAGERVTLGHPIANTAFHVLDAERQLVPPGVPGELYIGGDGVADGYHHRPELTRERFSPDPFGPGRLYRTGDLVRRLADGRLEYLGRLDHQIKLNGYRIELGEIESALRAHPQVTDAVVVLDGTGPAPRLAAHLTGGAVPSTDQLRSHLQDRLPAYMVPVCYEVYESFPLTPNGKIDRKALPAPTGTPVPAPSALELPPDATALDLVRAHTAALLGRPHTTPVDPTARFTDLGVDSLLAVQLAQRLARSTGRDVPAMAALQHPTPQALADHLDGRATVPAAQRITADATLPTGFTVAPAPRQSAGSAPEHILFTGATGFLGAFLLTELLRRTDATVHCLVRATDADAGHKRIRVALEYYRLPTDTLDTRVSVVPGDLSRLRLGLTDEDFDLLAATVDTVFHVGAEVSAVAPYEVLKAANVDGTRTLLDLAARHRPSAFHHISTTEVFPAPVDPGRHPDETTPTGPLPLLNGGYAQTKWAAEHLVRQAQAKGLPTALHRLPRLFGDQAHGACQHDDLLWRILAGSVRTKSVPEGITAAYDIVPVDHAAACLVTLALTQPLDGRAHHLTSATPTTFTALTDALTAAGHRLAPVPLTRWRTAILEDPGNPAQPVLDVFTTHMAGGSWSDLTLDNTRTRNTLGAAHPAAPPLATETLRRHITFLTNTGLLPPPW